MKFRQHALFTNRKLGRKGSALLQVLGAVAFLSAGFYALSTYVIQQRTQIFKNNSVVQTRLALQSTVDYAIYGIRQKWCFHQTLQQDPVCDLKHDGNVERVIMSVDQENFIKELIAMGIVANPGGPISLPSIDRYVELKALTSSHPLFVITSRLKPDKLHGIHLRISRDDSPQLPRAGREVFLKVQAYFAEGANGEPIKEGGHVLSVASYISVHPREVGSFALITPRDLHLDTNYNDSLTYGDLGFHRFGGLGAVGGPGLKFLSPVFVNRNLHLPAPDQAADRGQSEKIYTPVTFADKVILGNGGVLEGGRLYIPASAGGNSDRLWSDNRLFGGLQKGIENDGSVDLGLDYFSGNASGAGAADPGLMAQCIERNLKRSTYDAIKGSKAYANVRSGSSGASTRTYDLWMSEGNSFSPQTNELNPPNMDQWDGGTFTRSGAPTKNAVVKVAIEAGPYSLTTSLPINGSVEIKAPPPPSSGNGNGNNSGSGNGNGGGNTTGGGNGTGSGDGTGTGGNGTGPGGGTTNGTGNGTASASAAGDGSGPGGSGAGSDGGTGGGGSGGTGSGGTNGTGSGGTGNSGGTNGDNNGGGSSAVPATIRLSVEVVNEGGYDQPHKVKVSLTILDGSSLKDKSGKQINEVSVALTAMDSTFFEGRSTLSASDQTTHVANMTTYLNASFDAGDKEFQLPSSSSATRTGPPVTVAEDKTNYGEIDKNCADSTAASGGAAFGSAPWDYSFAPSTRTSWNFAGLPGSVPGPNPVINTLTFDVNNSHTSRTPIVFQVRSIARNCVIKSTANFVTGFYACDHLTIEPRTEPLRLIATFITNQLTIDPSAYRAGITWSSIYHPQAVYELRRTRTLRTSAGQPCSDTPKSPIWHPIPSMVETADRFNCNVISLRAKADPFQWTSVDPDCGIMQGKSSTSCKKRVTHFLVIEHSRETGL